MCGDQSISFGEIMLERCLVIGWIDGSIHNTIIGEKPCSWCNWLGDVVLWRVWRGGALTLFLVEHRSVQEPRMRFLPLTTTLWVRLVRNAFNPSEWFCCVFHSGQVFGEGVDGVRRQMPCWNLVWRCLWSGGYCGWSSGRVGWWWAAYHMILIFWRRAEHQRGYYALIKKLHKLAVP